MNEDNKIIRLRNDSEANFTARNTELRAGETAHITSGVNKGRHKIGPGRFNELDYTDKEVRDSVAAEAAARAQGDANTLGAAKDYTDEQIADTVAATQTWLPAVDTSAHLPAVTDTSRNWLCRVRNDQTVYQCVAGQTAWTPYSDKTDLVNELELAGAVSGHDESETAHEDIRAALAAEEQARESADQNLQEQINTLVPEGLENLPELLAHKAPVESPAFTGTPTVPSKTAAAANDGTLIATEAQVALKADLANPLFTGTPSAPTAAAKNNSTQIATTAYADRAGHPVGSYYTQYSVSGRRNIGDIANGITDPSQNMFPASESPALLFGGTWSEMYISENLFFKTAPVTIETNRGKVYNTVTQKWSGAGTAGIQEDAIRDIFGQAQWDLMGYVGSSGNIGDGAFYYGEPLDNIRACSHYGKGYKCRPAK